MTTEATGERARPTCATCRFWEPPHPRSKDPDGECRIDPARHGLYHPPADFWCGQHQPRPAGQPQVDEVVLAERRRCLDAVDAARQKFGRFEAEAQALAAWAAARIADPTLTLEG